MNNELSSLKYTLVDILIHNEIKNLSVFNEAEINELWTVYSEWVKGKCNAFSTAYDKLVELARVWSNFSPSLKKDFQVSKVIKWLNNEKDKIVNLYSRRLVDHGLLDLLSTDIMRILARNDAYKWISYEDECVSNVEYEVDLSPKTLTFNDASKAIINTVLSDPKLMDYHFIFDKRDGNEVAMEIQVMNDNLQENAYYQLMNSDNKFICLNKNFLKDGNKRVVTYHTELPEELLKYFGDLLNSSIKLLNFPIKEFGFNCYSDVEMFLSIYLNVKDKPGTFFKKENYNVPEIIKTYELFNNCASN